MFSKGNILPLRNCTSMNKILFSCFSLLASASMTATAEEEFPGAVDRYTHAQQMSDYGEIIDSVRGELSFETVDTVIPGSNGMDIVISRSLNTNDPVWGYRSNFGAMVNWHFEIPRISIVTTPWGVTRGWQPEQFDDAIKKVATTRTGICNDPYPGEGRAYQNDLHNSLAKKYWSGMKLKILGQSAQYLLANTDTTRYPTGTKWVTTNDWVVSCTASGDGFVVKSPKGITYTMDVLEARYNYSGVLSSWDTGRNTLFASQVKDNHGNVITYTYESTGDFYEVRNRNNYLITKYKLPWFYNKLTKITRNDPDGAQVVEQDWRYVSVRRTMIFLEQSVKAAARAYVFKPNDANTWAEVKSMISSFLTEIWKEGGLHGAQAAEAFQVAIGLGTTMTSEDILNGFMRVTVKVAVVRPAEYIVITFQQEMAKS